MKLFRCLFLNFLVMLMFSGYANAQIADTSVTRKLLMSKDSVDKPLEKNLALRETDSIKLKDPRYKDPRKAAIRSAILPGWGQVYNKKGWAWKVPIVYGALGGTALYFFDNLSWYKDFRLGYKVAVGIAQHGDSTGYNNINRIQVKRAVDNNLQNELKYHRDNFRKDVDYSAVYFIAAWALNVVWAATDAHLSTFDVSQDISFMIQPGYSELAKTNGVSLVLRFK